MGEDLLRYSNKIESSDLRQCLHDHYLTNKAYLRGITVRNIYESFTHKMAAKASWHRYGTKLRHCHTMYIPIIVWVCQSVRPRCACSNGPHRRIECRWCGLKPNNVLSLSQRLYINCPILNLTASSRLTRNNVDSLFLTGDVLAPEMSVACVV